MENLIKEINKIHNETCVPVLKRMSKLQGDESFEELDKIHDLLLSELFNYRRMTLTDEDLTKNSHLFN